MPKATPSIKVRNVSRLGAKVLLHGDDFDVAAGAKAKTNGKDISADAAESKRVKLGEQELVIDSKRREKLLQSKKKLLKYRDKGTKLVFDDDGNAQPIYQLQGEEDFQKEGPAAEQRVRFVEEDPGRQSMSGSFNPIDEGEWAEQAYIGPTEQLFNAIVLGDREEVRKLIARSKGEGEGAGEDGALDIDRRDHVGRTPLQVAILAREAEIACDLVDAGARMTARLVCALN